MMLHFVRPLRRLYRLGAGYARFCRDLACFQRLARRQGARLGCRWRDWWPCVLDRTATTEFDRHYVYHTAWAARVLAQTRPKLHVDIGSSLYFMGIVSAFVPVVFHDYRVPDLQLSNVEAKFGDLMDLPYADGSLESVSCMHVVEHVGLGRYGDPLEPAGDLRAIAELKRVLRPGGSLLLVTPVGRPRIAFNVHRVYSFETIREEACGELDLREFALVPDEPATGGLVIGATPALANSQEYGCGCFWFQKPDPATLRRQTV